jgi:hypothetical protein
VKRAEQTDSTRQWIEARIGITPLEAIEFLEQLADDERLRNDLQERPREVLLERNIDLFPGTQPTTVQLPEADALRAYARTLRERLDAGLAPDNPGSHGFVVLMVSHGSPPCPPPPED